MAKRTPVPGLSRAQALKARPAPLALVRTEEEAEGGLRVVVQMQRSRWQRWLGAPAEYNKKYVLDRMGREVYEACNGKTPVSDIIKILADRYKISQAEAELSVTAYLRTLMAKGLIAMGVGSGK